MNNAPKPSEEAIAAHLARENAAKEEPDEKPKGAKRGPKGPRTPKAALAGTPGTPTVDQKRLACRAVGYQIADTLIIAGRTLGGEEWNPVTQLSPDGKEVLFDERHNLREAWADMSEEYQWEKFPGWVGASLATAAYIGPRLTAPVTASKIEKLKFWLKMKFGKKSKPNDPKPDDETKGA